MKSINKFALLFAAAGILTSCSNDETIVQDSDNSGRTIHMVVTALRDGGQEGESRTTLEEDGIGNLAFKWSENDQIFVTDAEGRKKGFLKLKAGAGSNSGTFEGDLRGLDNGSVRLNYYYLGLQNSKEGYTNVKSGEAYTADYSSQLGTLESLSDYDMLSDFKNTLIQGDYSYSEFIDLKRRVSFARFLMNLPTEAEAPYKVTMSSPKLGNKATIQLTDADAPLAKMTYEQGNVVLENLNSNDFYITYIPTDGEHEITFEVEDKNGVAYTGSYTMKINVGQSQYLRRKNDKGEYQGIPIDMTESIDNAFRIVYYQNVGYHPGEKAPHQPKWTLGDLYNNDDVVYTTANEHTFTIKGYDNSLFSKNPLDLNLYEFHDWSSNWNSESTKYVEGQQVTLRAEDFKQPAPTVKDGKKYYVYTLNLYAYWMFNYTINYQLGDGVTVNGDDLTSKVTNTNGKDVQVDILDKVKGQSISKDGYKLIGWKEVGTETPIVSDDDNVWRFHQNKPIVTLEPVWEELPTTVETGSYKSGTLD